MTEVDTVMLEGGTPPVPASTPRQITSVAAESSSSLNENSESDATTTTTTATTTVTASNNIGRNSGTENKTTNIIEPTTTTTATAPPTPTTTTTSSSNGTQNASNKKTGATLAENTEKSKSLIGDQDHDNDNDDDDDCGGGGKVTTTTTEQECEEDSQVTSSSADIDGHHQNDQVDTTVSTKKESVKANLTSTSPSASTLQKTSNVGDNSNSQTVDGNDLVDGEAGETLVSTEAKTSPKIDGGATKKNINENENENENLLSRDSVNISDNEDGAKNDVDQGEGEGEVEGEGEGEGKGKGKGESNDVDDEHSKNSEKNLTEKPKNSVSKNVANSSDADAGQDGQDDKISVSNCPNSPSAANVKQKAVVKEASNAPVVDLVEQMDVDDDVDPLGMDNDVSIVNSSYEAKNGVDVEKNASNNNNNNNGNIVDLDDDTDDENCDADDVTNASSASNDKSKQSNGSKRILSNAIKSPNSNIEKSVCSDSDGAVVIGSDSENENENSTPINTRNANAQQQKPLPSPNVHESDDDDDDCVVIEDDSPAEMTTTSKASDQVRRKSVVLDSENNSDDSQPPSKRQRRAVGGGGGGIGMGIGIGNCGGSQLAIKDARSLLPADMQSSPGNSINAKKPEGGIYPVNITPATSNMITQAGIGPPKLAPIGSASTIGLNTGGTAVGGVMPGLVGVNANANLLPGLTDDMFVLEAPSFIVPYIYEKPPTDSLKDIVKEIESKYELSKDDLTEADKLDEFDMMTEQNKADKDLQAATEAGKKKKKRRFAADVDDSWSEESEEDDDDDEDDDSESNVRTKVLIKEVSDDLTALKGAIKPASAVTQSIASTSTSTSVPAKPGQENYFESPLGKFFMDIGVGLVQEFVQTDLIRLQKRKMRKSLGKNISDFERAIAALSGNLEASKKKNSAFKFTMKRCEFCNFKSESALAMAHHYETPHTNGPLYKCNFCTFEIRNATEIVYHMEAMHNIKARLIKPLPYHQCPNCGFEDNGRAKLARHQPVCAKKFRPELNLAPPNDWEAPAKIPRIKPRHGLVGTATAYQAMAAQAAAQKAALATIQQQQQQQQQARNLQAAALAAQNAINKIRGRPPALSKVGGSVGPNGTAAVLRGPNTTGPRPMATNVVLPNNYQLPGNQIIPATNALHAGKKAQLPGQPSISITPLPRQNAAPQSASPSTSKITPAGIKPGRSPAAGNKAQFVICEICDGYIKDLEQLRNHMQWMHEVKIHPKMIYNRPPLNCQKCQFRFFTDQGLERHLLGSHGLVTSSMQEAANKGKDAGRCPVCGRMYQWKLLNHVARDHHMTLKPAHLSYKCTVCTATFGMYKQFETHVYTAHSTVAKKAMDSKKNNASGSASSAGLSAGGGGSAASGSGVNQRGGANISAAASNDALLKPLKINDEITIIPQPASKPRITNMESHVID